MGTKGGIERFKEMAENYRDNPKILNKIIQNMVEKIEELEIDLQIATTRADALQNAFDRCEAKATAYDRLLAKKLTDEELDNPPASKILKEMAEKAEAYDRLMSGGKKTPMEWADLFGMYFGVDLNGWGGLYLRKPHKSVSCWEAFAWDDLIARIPPNLIQWTGIWQDSLCKPKSITNSSDSLTLPDGWEANHAK